jgi:hypothetical protein
MDRDDDVERLFSWIKTPDLHYREFAGEREVADAVATWPALRDAVTEPSHPGEPDEPSYEHEPPHEAEPRPAARAPLGDRLSSLFAHREPPPPEPPVVRRPEPPPVAEEAAGEVPWAPESPRPSPVFARLEPAPPPEPEPVPEPPAEDEFRGFDEPQAPPPAAEPAQAGQQRPLGAILSRVAHPSPPPRGDRYRAAGAPGLGPVFRRLR